MCKPYRDIRHDVNSKSWVREFEPTHDSSELVWHRDRANRTVEVLDGNGWVFQMDECIPFEIKKGDTITIPRYVFHRIFKAGNCPLKIQIHETE